MVSLSTIRNVPLAYPEIHIRIHINGVAHAVTDLHTKVIQQAVLVTKIEHELMGRIAITLQCLRSSA